MLKKLPFIVLGMFLLHSCSADEGDDGQDGQDGMSDCNLAIKEQVAQGKFANADFTVGSGSMRFISNKPFFALYLETISGNVCDSQNEMQAVLFGSNIELKVGSYKLDNLNTVSFNTRTSEGVDIELATCGTIEITAITESAVMGKLVADANGANFINGTFNVVRCK